MVVKYLSIVLFSRILPCCVAVLFSSVVLWADDDGLEETEEEAVAPLKIKSQTELWSANYYINGELEKDREEDRKRTSIGIGEKITLLLIGKPKGKLDELEWSVEGNGFLQTDFDQFKGKEKIELTAKQELIEDTSIKIRAKTSEGFQKEITINIKVPVEIKGEKFEGAFVGSDGKTINTKDYKRKKGQHGIIGFIEVTLFPTDVSFKKINAIERDGGLEWPGKANGEPKPKLASGHGGAGANHLIKIRDKNNCYDFVSEVSDLVGILNTIRDSKMNPQIFWWECRFFVHLMNENKDLILLDTSNQKFHIEAISRFNTKTIIEKLGVKFERNSNEDQL